MNILILEDDLGTLNAITLILQLEGFNCFLSSTVEAALLILKENCIDCALIDYYIQCESAEVVVKELKLQGIPFTIMSAWPNLSLPGVGAILAKPFELDQLYEIILSIRNKKESLKVP